jgi:redox-sensitive bicupin YhaK (pirin superfamily)
MITLGLTHSLHAIIYGPIVMNTQGKLQRAVNELREGTFIKS